MTISVYLFYGKSRSYTDSDLTFFDERKMPCYIIGAINKLILLSIFLLFFLWKYMWVSIAVSPKMNVISFPSEMSNLLLQASLHNKLTIFLISCWKLPANPLQRMCFFMAILSVNMMLHLWDSSHSSLLKRWKKDIHNNINQSSQ